MIVPYEPAIRIGFFASIFVLMILCEYLWPKRTLSLERRQRWPGHILLSLLNTFLIRFFFPTAVVGVALFYETASESLFNLLKMPFILKWILGWMILDLTIYIQHRLFHQLPGLWRIHRVHHMDLDVDATTGFRFHPVEIIISFFIKVFVVGLLGIPGSAVMVFEIALSSCSLFNHSNLALPDRVDKILRKIIITPDLHRIHHSTDHKEHNRNFGFTVSWWDYLFKTYCAAPKAGHLQMQLGLKDERVVKNCATLWGILKAPCL